jgi:hypothetical protein
MTSQMAANWAQCQQSPPVTPIFLSLGLIFNVFHPYQVVKRDVWRIKLKAVKPFQDNASFRFLKDQVEFVP